MADGDDILGSAIERNDRWLVEDDPLSFLPDEGVRGTEIDTDVVGEDPKTGHGLELRKEMRIGRSYEGTISFFRIKFPPSQNLSNLLTKKGAGERQPLWEFRAFDEFLANDRECTCALTVFVRIRDHYYAVVPSGCVDAE